MILTPQHNASNSRKLFARISEMLRPKPRLNVLEWAETYRVLGKGVSAKSMHGPKRYSAKDAPFQREILTSLTDKDVRCTVLCGASQTLGKTEMMNNLLGWSMHWRPQSSVVMYPTIESAEKYSKKKFTPMTQATPELDGLIKPSRSRDSGNTILVKEFTGGSVYFVGSNSPSSLRGASGSLVIGDEIDAAEDGVEGDPIQLLFKRVESFPNAIKLLISTPTIKGHSRIWKWFLDSDQRYYFVPCPHCGRFQKFEWSNVHWPEGRPEEAYIECVNSECKAHLTDEERIAMIQRGEWRATAAFTGVRGYHLNGLYTPWRHHRGFKNRLHQMAVDFLDAKAKGPAALKVWVNTFLSECWEDITEAKPVDAVIAKRAENYGGQDDHNPIIPQGACLLTCAVDVQGNRLDIEVVGHGVADETWGIEHRQLLGDPQDTSKPNNVWHQLDELLAKTYTHESGAKLSIVRCIIDAGDGKNQEVVKRYAKPRQYKVWVIKGSSTPNAPLIATGNVSKKGTRLIMFTIGTDTGKSTVYARLGITEPGPRYMHFPTRFGYDEEYYKQLVSESCRTKIVKGKVVRTWDKDRERNEVLDLRVYTLACIELLNPNMKKVAENLSKSKPKQEDVEQKKPKDYILKPHKKEPEPEQEKPAEAQQKKRKVRFLGGGGGGFGGGGFSDGVGFGSGGIGF